jgi:hypothetical protein
MKRRRENVKWDIGVKRGNKCKNGNKAQKIVRGVTFGVLQARGENIIFVGGRGGMVFGLMYSYL